MEVGRGSPATTATRLDVEGRGRRRRGRPRLHRRDARQVILLAVDVLLDWDHAFAVDHELCVYGFDM